MSKVALLLLCLAALAPGAEKTKKKPEPTPLDLYVREAKTRDRSDAQPTTGAIWHPGSPLSDTARDLKASQVDDLITILVMESASAVATGNTKTARQSSAEYGVGSIFGKTRIPGPLANMASLSGNQQLTGDGTTSRSTTLQTTLTARISDMLPNGYLVVEGAKTLTVNSENQIVTVRGVIRPADIMPGNQVRSDRLAQLEVRINGKGVVGDAIRRPNFLFRLLLGLLPF